MTSLEDMERAIAQQADFDITDHCLRFLATVRSAARVDKERELP